jgi:hypothetical protein
MPKEPQILATFPLRIERDKLDRLREIAEQERRTLVGELRWMVDERLAAEDARKAGEAA